MLIDPKPVQIEASPVCDWARTTDAKGKVACGRCVGGGMKWDEDWR